MIRGQAQSTWIMRAGGAIARDKSDHYENSGFICSDFDPVGQLRDVCPLIRLSSVATLHGFE